VVGGERASIDASAQALFEFQVDTPATAIVGSGVPAYPQILRAARIEGRVTAMFVVDTTGRADASTFKVLDSDHDLFTAAVKRALPGMRFTPARARGGAVKMWVQQAFEFRLAS
jgi:TonB family protein